LIGEIVEAHNCGGSYEQGKRDEVARDLLAPVYDWFTEGFDALDLVEEVTRLYVGSG
jgi:hypothetical protein